MWVVHKIIMSYYITFRWIQINRFNDWFVIIHFLLFGIDTTACSSNLCRFCSYLTSNVIQFFFDFFRVLISCCSCLIQSGFLIFNSFFCNCNSFCSVIMGLLSCYEFIFCCLFGDFCV